MQNNKNKKNMSWIHFTISLLGIIGGFALAFICDMPILRDCIRVVMNEKPAEAAGLAIAVALIADTCALSWGVENVRKSAGVERTRAKYWAALWIFGGIVYIALEAFSLIVKPEIGPMKLISEIGQLLLSYLGSGIAIVDGIEYIADPDRWAKLNYCFKRKSLVSKISEIEEKILALKTAEKYEKNLVEMHDIQLQNIRDYETTSINYVANNVLQANGDIEPSGVQEIAEDVLNEHFAQYPKLSK